jgi:tRNA dimethylallyltransferase
MKKRKVIIVLGATASGKSGLALELAKMFDGFLISADSRQIYRQMDIGTNKDVLVEKAGKFFVEGIREYMVNVADPEEKFSLDDWLNGVKEILEKEKDKLAIVVGGTGLYLSALVDNYHLCGGYDEKLRAKLEKLVEKRGMAELIKKIKKIDPEIENKIDMENPRRVIRAAEICLETKKPFSREQDASDFEFLEIGVEVAREKLYEKINKRVDQMIDLGLVEEVKGLMARGYDEKLSAMTGIGYRQVCQFLNKEISGAEAIRLIKRDTRRYAKRQLTWFRRDKNIRWVTSFDEAGELVIKFICLRSTELLPSLTKLRQTGRQDK